MTEPTHRRADDHRIAELQTSTAELKVQMTGLKTQHEGLQDQITANTELTTRVKEDTSGLVDAWITIAAGVKLLIILGRFAKWVAIVAGAISAVGAAFYALTHWGGPPSQPPNITP